MLKSAAMQEKGKDISWNDFIFSDKISFDQKALEVFRYQSAQNDLYKKYIATLGVDPLSVHSLDQIPFLPVSFFKSHKIIAGNDDYEIAFTSSGTTGDHSTHYVKKLDLYIKSFSTSFSLFYGDVQQYCILALLPSYLERQGSSLVLMCEHMVHQSGHLQSGFYLHNLDELNKILLDLKEKKQKTILIGVTYALLDLAASFPLSFPDLIIMETGGMKGRRKEMVREEVHEVLKKAFDVPAVHSEYGMTELLSQAWSSGNGLYFCPTWMKVLVRNVNDPMDVKREGSGGISIIDLANIYSCSFIATQDLGVVQHDGSFTVIGRFDNSDLRGCNLMIE